MHSRITQGEIARYIDHTNVKPDATTHDIKVLCEEARKYMFHSVCVTPYRVRDARDFLGKDSHIEIICVIGFPYGLTTTEEKILEAKRAISDGATEIDMVINIGAVKDGKWGFVREDIATIAKFIKPIGLKVIMEVGFLTRLELEKACLLAKEALAAYVKTSTGYGPRGATTEDIKLMRKTVGVKMGVKASGGIHDYKTAFAMIEAGADRIGTSSGLDIIGATTNKPQTKANTKKPKLSNE